VLYRLTRLHFPDAAYVGRAALFRFDAPDRSFGVCYLGTSLDCCLLEVVTPTYRATAAPLLIIIQSQADHRNHDVHDAGYRNSHRASMSSDAPAPPLQTGSRRVPLGSGKNAFRRIAAGHVALPPHDQHLSRGQQGGRGEIAVCTHAGGE
jgi:hypothetical protein